MQASSHPIWPWRRNSTPSRRSLLPALGSPTSRILKNSPTSRALRLFLSVLWHISIYFPNILGGPGRQVSSASCCLCCPNIIHIIMEGPVWEFGDDVGIENVCLRGSLLAHSAGSEKLPPTLPLSTGPPPSGWALQIPPVLHVPSNVSRSLIPSILCIYLLCIDRACSDLYLGSGISIRL